MHLALLIALLLMISMGLLLSLAPRFSTAMILAAARRLAGFRHRTARCDDLRIVYLDGGRGEPLLLLHGLGADKDSFALVGRKLRSRYRVIIPDLPGFGKSDRPAEASYRVADQLKRLIAFLDTLGIQRFHVGGNSMGGLLAGALATAYPQRVLSLWLLAPAGVKAAQPSELMRRIAAADPALPIFARTASEMRAVIAFVTHRPPYLPGFIVHSMAHQQREAFSLNQRIVAQLQNGPWLDELLAHRPRVPALVVWGAQDRALDVSGAGVLGGLLPNAEVIVMPDVGHVPMIEASARTASDYLRFRDALSQRRA